MNKKLNLPSMMGCFEALEEEHDYDVDDIEGKLPLDLNGTFFRNGPGRLKLGDEVFGHWFDGDGMVAATRFSNGKVHFKNRFTRTRKYINETKAQKILYRGMGNAAPGGVFKNALRPPANPANTSLMLNDGKLLALWEGGHPFALDPVTLQSEGNYHFSGDLKINQPFSAHPKRHSKTGYTYNFGAGISGIGLKGPKFCFWLYKISPQGKIVKKKSFPMSIFPFFHDFALTENFAVFFINSIVFQDIGKMVMGKKQLGECLAYDENMPCEAIVVDLNTLEIAKIFQLDPMAVVHFGNSFERDGKLIVEACRTTSFEANEHLLNLFSPDFDFSTGGARYCQFEMDLSSGSINWRDINEEALPCEFPQWDMRRTACETRYAYAASFCENGTKNFFNSIQKFDKKTGESSYHDCGSYRFTGEPLFVPRDGSTGEDDGYLLSYVYDGNINRSEVMVLDARNPEDKICTVKFRHHIPQGFHGIFSHEAF